MDALQWILAALLGLSLAASIGLNAFLPLLMLAGAAHFRLADVQLNDNFAWLASEQALFVLVIATVLEIIGDKIPAVDHALHALGVVIRPIVGTLAAAAVFTQADPTIAAIAGLIIGTPAALGFHAAKAGTRAASSATTLGCANPILSVVEDCIAFALVLIGFFAPLLVPVVLILVGLLLWKLVKAARLRRALKETHPTSA